MPSTQHPAKRLPPARILTLLAVAAIAVGVFLMAYPTATALVHARSQSGAIADYDQSVAQMQPSEIQAAFDEAVAYNDGLADNAARYDLSTEERTAYQKALDPAESGVMGYVDIPSLELTLPIYHGTSDEEMQKGACHVEGTALPVGQPSTHAAVTAHRGEPGASYFKDLDRLAEGDTFSVTVLGQTTTYEVDRIIVVLPDDVGSLGREEGVAYCTLITCTPYGVNSHRLLVRGHSVGVE